MKSIYGKPDTIAATGQGSALPEVPDVILDKESETDIVVLHWNKPKLVQKVSEDIIYGVYYGTSVDELRESEWLSFGCRRISVSNLFIIIIPFAEPRIVTTNTTVRITDLLQCESYYVSVGIVGPIGPGPLARSPKRLETHYNSKKPPRNLNAVVNDHHEMVISWQNSCPFVQEETGYIVSEIWE